MDFMFNNTSFQDPCVRQLSKAVAVGRFFTCNVTFIFDEKIIETEYTMYPNDFYMMLFFKLVANIT